MAHNVIHLPPAWMLGLSALYLSALVYFVIRLVWVLYRTARLVRDAEPISMSPERDDLWNYCRQTFSVEDALMLRSQQIASPVTLGLVRPVLLLPQDFSDGCTMHDLSAAWGHECAHMKRRDFQKNLFYEIASLVIAFHPVTWFIKSQISQTREMICDGMATEKLIDSHQYAQSLLRLVTMISCNARVSASNAIGIFDANILERRIMMIFTQKQHVTSAMRYGLMIPAALLLVSVASMGGAAALSVQAQGSNAPAASSSGRKTPPKGHICTYFTAQGEGLPGTCGIRKNVPRTFYCIADKDSNLSQEQIACGANGKLRLATPSK